MKNKIDPKKGKAKIMIVDDHPIMRRGLAELINIEKDMVVCAEAETSAEALDAIKIKKPDLLLVDLSLREENGLELVKNVKAHYPSVPMLVLSMHDESFYAERALRAGAKGYIMKQQAASLVLIAIRRVLSGEVYVSETMSSQMLKQVTGQKDKTKAAGIERLSDRELEVFRLIGNGFGTRQIAQRLSRSVKTVETYREHIKLKLDLKDSSELVRHAIQWLQSEP